MTNPHCPPSGPLHRCRNGIAAAICAAIALPGAPSRAQPAPQAFEELEAKLADHPSLAALRMESDAREELSVAERALPDPVVSFGVSDIPVGDVGFRNDPDSAKMIGASQEIPNPGVRRARSARERGEAAGVSAQLSYKLAVLKAELIAALAEKQRAREQIALAESQLQKYGQLQEILRGEIEAGRPVFYRLSQVDVERADVERTIIGLRTMLAQSDAALIDLVGEAPKIAPPDVIMAPWDGGALTLHATRIADAGVAIAKAGVREGKAAFWPNFGANFTYMQRQDGVGPSGDPFAGNDWFAAGVSVSVPLWAPKSQSPRLRAARARQAGAEFSYQAVYRDARERLTSFMAEHHAAERNVVLFEQKAKALDATIAALRRNYEAGNGDYVQVLDAEIGKMTLLSQLAAERANMIVHAAHFNSELVTP
ncbi:MAG: TolC family protein [Parvularculaceae bacterium]